eukprot:1545060-Alexandrium_andersonii.AAC.1
MPVAYVRAGLCAKAAFPGSRGRSVRSFTKSSTAARMPRCLEGDSPVSGPVWQLAATGARGRATRVSGAVAALLPYCVCAVAMELVLWLWWDCTVPLLHLWCGCAVVGAVPVVLLRRGCAVPVLCCAVRACAH